jgi:protein TonB
MDANRTIPRYELKSDLARFSLARPAEEGSRKLAWVNSICILFLLIGILGDKSGAIENRHPPPLQEIVPAIVEPVPQPPQTSPEPQPQEPSDQKPEAPQVVVVTPEVPSISFAVPTIGNVVVPNALAKPPPLNPLQPVAPLKARPQTLDTTGGGGERPQPPYPRIALEQGQQGTVTLLLTADEAGNIVSAEVKGSSGSPILDRAALDYVRRHWLLPRGAGSRMFETSIIYRLQHG